ncbi:MAG: hypothetical protein NC339_08900 [Muribaculaceae bacterium]|nr:hypothetical protein [Muribaculaceae bacterium]
MKKSLVLSLALCAAMGVNAEVLEYDFNTTPSFFPYLQAPIEELGMGQSGNYDFIDKNGIAKVEGSDGELLQEKDEAGEWHATAKKVRISLADGMAYYANEAGKWVNEGEEMDYSEPFIMYGDKGPSRTIWMIGWGSLDAWEDVNYNAAVPEDWVSSKHAIAFNRNANSGSREDTYIQLPEVEGAANLTIWAGHAGGKYVTELRVKIVPVVDGVEQPAFSFYKPLDQTVAKRYYKLTINNLDNVTTDAEGNRAWADAYQGGGKVAYRIGCHKSEVGIYHVKVETNGNTGIADVIAPAEADENAPVYNVLGQRVNDSYKGLVIKNGVKYIQK